MKAFSKFLVCTFGLYASAVLSAPACNPVPYGSKCTQCSGWMVHSSWANIACNLNNGQNNLPGFACDTPSAKKMCKVKMTATESLTDGMNPPAVKFELESEQPQVPIIDNNQTPKEMQAPPINHNKKFIEKIK